MGWPEGVPFPHLLTYPTMFYVGDSDTEVWRENGILFLSPGDGVMTPDAKRYRVRESWLSFEKNGHFGTGMHVFLSPVEAMGNEDTLGRIIPHYFT